VLRILIFKGLTASRLYKSFGVKGLSGHMMKKQTSTSHHVIFSLAAFNVVMWQVLWLVQPTWSVNVYFNLLKTERRLLYLKTQSVPLCKHFSSRL
jgi:hypothetical protein